MSEGVDERLLDAGGGRGRREVCVAFGWSGETCTRPRSGALHVPRWRGRRRECRRRTGSKRIRGRGGRAEAPDPLAGIFKEEICRFWKRRAVAVYEEMRRRHPALGLRRTVERPGAGVEGERTGRSRRSSSGRGTSRGAGACRTLSDARGAGGDGGWPESLGHMLYHSGWSLGVLPCGRGALRRACRGAALGRRAGGANGQPVRLLGT